MRHIFALSFQHTAIQTLFSILSAFDSMHPLSLKSRCIGIQCELQNNFLEFGAYQAYLFYITKNINKVQPMILNDIAFFSHWIELQISLTIADTLCKVLDHYCTKVFLYPCTGTCILAYSFKQASEKIWARNEITKAGIGQSTSRGEELLHSCDSALIASVRNLLCLLL